MATVMKLRFLQPTKASGLSSLLFRSSSSAASQQPSVASQQPSVQEREGWFSKLLVRKIEPIKESHSRMLSDKETIYQLQTHFVKPEYLESYLKNYEQFSNVVKQRDDLGTELVGSWVVDVGIQDQVLHLWRYTGGYTGLGQANQKLHSDPEYAKLALERSKYLKSRQNQYLLSFSFWNAPKPRAGSNLYEVRSYILKPGTMIEWGNNWARAIHYRQDNTEAFCGLFSQSGRLYNVHHIWVYKDLKTRKETREAAWQKPGWDECVAYTVPLIREMDSRIMYPASFSPTQ